MKKIMTFICFIIICLFAMTGCMGKTLPDMPSNAIDLIWEPFTTTHMTMHCLVQLNITAGLILRMAHQIINTRRATLSPV